MITEEDSNLTEKPKINNYTFYRNTDDTPFANFRLQNSKIISTGFPFHLGRGAEQRKR